MTERRPALSAAALGLLFALPAAAQDPQDRVVDTAQLECYSDQAAVAFPPAGQPFSGQDAQHVGILPAYRDNGDGTVSDLNTGLMWQRDPGDKRTWSEAVAGAGSLSLAGHGDWRLPSIVELYSLMRFDGWTGLDAAGSSPYLDTTYFDFEYGDESIGERFIDAQYCSSTEYVGLTMGGDETVFGVNFADGRIKGYPKVMPFGGAMEFFVRYVRGNPDYGDNRFVDNGDGTVDDQATGLTWMQVDSGALGAGGAGDGKLDWQEALAWAENLNYAGHDDWRLPNAKELQGIVDYTQAPTVTGNAAIDPAFFAVSEIESYFWTGTTHLDGPPSTYGQWGVYIAFGRAMGWMEMPPGSGNYQFVDVHGAGAQRSDPKSGDPSDPKWQYGHGPQGDDVRIFHFARCVRGEVGESLGGGAYTLSASSGGAIALELDAGVSNGLRDYLMVGSLSGTQPGLPLAGGALLPLNLDGFSALALGLVNSPSFTGFYGVLDAQGRASATLDSLGPLSSAAVGLELTLAFTLLSPAQSALDFASNAIAIAVLG